jgi:glycosyltransferase involved in cell wall biosynthesis
MKISVVSDTDINGGAARAAHRLHLGLRALGVDSEMLVRRKIGNSPEVHLLVPGIAAKIASRLRYLLNRGAVNRYRSSWPVQPENFSLAGGRVRPDWTKVLHETDVVNLNWVAESFDFGLLYKALTENQRIVWTLHDMYAFTGGCHYTGGCSRFKQACGACPTLGSDQEQDISAIGHSKKLEALNLFSDDQLTVVTPSRWLDGQSRSSSLLGRFNHRIIPYGIDTNCFRPKDRRSIRTKFGIAKNEKVLLMLALSGSSRRKGSDLLQAAIAQIAERDSLCLLCVGSEVDWPGIRTINLGEIKNDEQLSEAYVAADVMVAPSREDNMPLTVLESMACGTPVVAFNIGGMPDMIEPGRNGLLAVPEDSDDLARCIERLLVHPELSDKMRVRCREVAVQRYPLELQSTAYLQLFESLLEKHS